MVFEGTRQALKGNKINKSPQVPDKVSFILMELFTSRTILILSTFDNILIATLSSQ